jgi:hypothetical protein
LAIQHFGAMYTTKPEKRSTMNSIAMTSEIKPLMLNRFLFFI